MAGWITRCAIADRVMAARPTLSRRDFAMGGIAPDCNLENADRSAFIPPREVTHFMQGGCKTAADADAFYEKYLMRRADEIKCPAQRDFLLGYYAHLLADGLYQAMIRDEFRVRAVWGRIRADAVLSLRARGMAETWDSVKILLTRAERARETRALEAEYLAEHPESVYLTEILPTKTYPDWMDILPSGAIPRKIAVMGCAPSPDPDCVPVALSRQEYREFTDRAVTKICKILPKEV